MARMQPEQLVFNVSSQIEVMLVKLGRDFGTKSEVLSWLSMTDKGSYKIPAMTFMPD
jgi:hypothetical protein